jgi:ABC-2 type transport system permease protein
MTQISTGRLFARSCAAEWTRLWTVRSTWWLAAATAAVMVGIALPAALSTTGRPDPPYGDPAWNIANLTAMPAQFALLTMALTAVTSDYATGGIMATLQWTPRRAVLFGARAIVAVATATGVGVLVAAVSGVVAYVVARPVLSLPLAGGADVLGTVAGVFAGSAALAVGLGFLVRSTAAVLVSAFLLLLVLPGLLPQLGYSWLTDIADWLPGTNALFLLTGEPVGRGLSPTSAALTMLAWAGAALTLGGLRLVRDDAGR